MAKPELMKRLPDESYEAYKQRRKLINAWCKSRMQPKLVWGAKSQGTFEYLTLKNAGK